MIPEIQNLILTRTGNKEATVGIISLPLLPDAPGLRIDHPGACTIPIGWRKRHETPRRAIAYVVDEEGVPESLRLASSPGPEPAEKSSMWDVSMRMTVLRESYVAHGWNDYEMLRGVPAEECATAQGELVLTYGDRTLRIQAGATGPRGGPYYWENVQVDALWENQVARGVRVGGVIYNEDTYLWADFYFVLFHHGVVDLSAHFVNTKLHIKAYDFQGLPMIRFADEGLEAVEASLPADGMRFNPGMLFNFEDSKYLCSEEFPGRLISSEKDIHWYPVNRTYNSRKEDTPEREWHTGAARTFRCQFSLSGANPAMARYRLPAWWYARCRESSSEGFLPVEGRYDRMGEIVSDHVRTSLVRGRFDGGSANMGNDGDAGSGLMLNYYHTGRPELFDDALAHCTYWADLAVDHTDFTVHQWLGGWGWKTCAYTKFRDVLFGYLETGDPYFLDVLEMVAESHWMWYRSNWPRSTIGRDNFELGTWGLLWRFFDSERGRERSLEYLRMCLTVLRTRGTIGGQMGAGPHPGFLSSLFMTGVTMMSVLEVAHTAAEKGDDEALRDCLEALRLLHPQFVRDDREFFPSNYGEQRKDWGDSFRLMWTMMALRIYSDLSRLPGEKDWVTAGLEKALAVNTPLIEKWAVTGRHVIFYHNPIDADSHLLGARWEEGTLAIEPLGNPCVWPALQNVKTPLGSLSIETILSDGNAVIRFGAETEFPLRFSFEGKCLKTTSSGELLLEGDGLLPRQQVAKSGLDLRPYIARGFPGKWDKELATTPVVGIDRRQCQTMVRLCPETEAVLYGRDYSPTKLLYRPRMRPVLESIAGKLSGIEPLEKVTAAMAWVSEHVVHPHFTGPLAPDRGMTEEQLIQSGHGWCNEQVRVFIALCQIVQIPSRLCFLFHENTICGHTAAEVFLDGRWVFVDVTFGIVVKLPDGLFAEGRDLSGPYRSLAHEAYRPALEDYERRVLPYVEQCAGWCRKDRVTPDRGGDLLHTLGICNYIIAGVESV